MEKYTKFLTNISLAKEEEYSESAFNIGGLLTWIKFILTDDQPNANKQRIPREEFDNLINTGHFMPIKMASGGIQPGHDNSTPLGVITNLKKAGNLVEGIAGLWHKEREEDVSLIIEKLENGEPPQLSWEIFYSMAEENEETGITDLRGTSLRATTIVGLPAYSGRTPILAFSSKWSESYLEKLPNEAFLDEENRLYPFRDIEGNIDLSYVKNNLQKLEGKFLAKAEELLEEEDNSVDELKELKEKLTAAEAKINELNETLSTVPTLEKELEELREFKAEVDAEREKEQKLATIKQKFVEAGVEKDEEYFNEKAEMLLSMDENSIDFMIQEIVSFASSKKEDEVDEDAEASDKSGASVPNLKPDPVVTYDNPREIANALREQGRKNK